MSGIHVGFTGTRRGMTEAQKHTVTDLLRGADWLDHGDCVGSDVDAHEIARGLGIQVCIHPPISERFRAHCVGDFVHIPLDYIWRNRRIVMDTWWLIATPERPEERRSGTWSTVRYARRIGRRVVVVMPDGAFG